MGGKKNTREVVQKFLSLSKKYNELWLGPLGLIVFLLSKPLIKAYDPEAVVYTSDAIQKIFFGHVVFAACAFSVWVILKFTWPDVFGYLIKDFNNDFKTIPVWQKLFISFCLLALYLLGLIACMHVL